MTKHQTEEFVARAGRVLPPLVTPFAADEAVDHGALRSNVSRLAEEGVRGFVPLGSNSEAVHLSESEKLEVVESVRAAAPDAYVLAGTGQESTRETIRLSNLAVRAGADAVLVITPSFYLRGGNNDGAEQQVRHFLAVADGVQAPVWVYNVAKFTGVDLTPGVMARMLEHPNVAGVKDSSGRIDQLTPLIGADVDGVPLVGTASAMLAGLAVGVPGGVMALANAYPRELQRLHTLHEQGRTADAERLQASMHRVNKAVTADFGVPGLKHVCSRRGYAGGRVRSPLRDVDAAVARELDALLDEVAGELADHMSAVAT